MAVTQRKPARRPGRFLSRLHFLVRFVGLTGLLVGCVGLVLAGLQGALSSWQTARDTAEAALRGSNVQCDLAVADDLPPVEVDEAQICQAVQNLVVNAAEAMAGGGVVTIRADVADAANGENGGPERPHVRIAVEDRGVGIPKDRLQKIFDPFFTTKAPGSGLGLSAAYSIVRSHNGKITVRSEPGSGSVFTIWLPVSAAANGIPAEDAAGRSAMGNVLVMDDEKSIREVVLQMLRHIGYRAAAAKDGGEAITMYRDAREAGSPFDVVIMDLNIPSGMGGMEAVKRLRDLYPDVKAIVSSGYSNDPVLADYRAYGFQGVIAKPYRLKELGESIRTVIDQETCAETAAP